MSVPRSLFQRRNTTIQRCLSTNHAASDKPIYIATPIFYVNSVPHIGHLYTVVLADSIKRWFELKGRKTVLSTGTDEHGLKIQKSAEKQNLSPKELCDTNAARFKELFNKAHISYTHFLRTTEERHRLAVHQVWNILKDSGFMTKGHHEGWYSASDETFVANTSIVELRDPHTHDIQRYSKESGHVLEWIKEENYKFHLSKFRERLLTWLDEHPSVIRPKSRYNETRSWLEEKDLNDLSISRLRSRLEWGWPVPNDETHTIYVWFDALLGYLTATGYPWNHESQVDSAFPPDYHIIGKDILRFHAIYWPAFLWAANLPLPKTIVAHAHWTVNTTKMSKSLGNVINPFQILDEYAIDPVRYFLLRGGPLNDDANFSTLALKERVNSDLVDQLGNLLSRSLAPGFYKDGQLPPCGPLDDMDCTLIKRMQQLPDIVDEFMIDAQVQRALEAIFENVSHLNRYFTYKQPWILVKDSSSQSQLDTVLYITIESLRIVATLLKSAMPSTMDRLLDILSVSKTDRTFSNTRWQSSSSDRPRLHVGPSPLFNRHK